MQTTQHVMIGHLPIWTVTVDDKIIQSQDFDDVLIAIGRGVMDEKKSVKHVTIQDGDEVLFDGDIEVREIAEQ